MLTLLCGPAGSGKTDAIYEAILSAHLRGEKTLLIVPEQYSHEAERTLAEKCGDSVCLNAEVLSFSRLCNRIMNETGLSRGTPLDNGGRILVMQLALTACMPSLRAFGGEGVDAEFLTGLVAAYEELRTAKITPRQLGELADTLSGPTADKLSDFSLLFEAYDQCIPEDLYDPCDRLDILSDGLRLPSAPICDVIFVDGFTDFTRQEICVLESLLRRSADVTVSVNAPSSEGLEPEFELPRATLRRLRRMADQVGAPLAVKDYFCVGKSRKTSLMYLCENLFVPEPTELSLDDSCVHVAQARSFTEECELAASRMHALVRDGYRWKDFAVVARGWESFEAQAAGIFSSWDVPLQVVEKKNILDEPVISCLTGLLRTVLTDWSLDSILPLLKTDLLPFSQEDRFLLENYLFLWDVHGKHAWTRPDGFTLPALHYDEEHPKKKEASDQLLSKLNEMRAKLARPLEKLSDAVRTPSTSANFAKALWECAVGLEIPQAVSARAEKLEAGERADTAQEYRQLWDIFIDALEQLVSVLNEQILNAERFSRLLELVLGCGEVASIPASLDRVMAGDLTRLRKRGVKHLFVLNAGEDQLPKPGTGSGLISDTERQVLLEAGLELSDTPESRMARELNAVYESFSTPSDAIWLSWAGLDDASRPSFIVKRIMELFRLAPTGMCDEDRTWAPRPCFELAVSATAPDARNAARSAYTAMYDSDLWRAKLLSVRSASGRCIQNLTKEAVNQLWKSQLTVNPTSVECFETCRFRHFLKNGLKLETKKISKLDSLEAGTFFHYVLQFVCSKVKEAGGFRAVDDEALKAFTHAAIKSYENAFLAGINARSPRYLYLLHHLSNQVDTIIRDLADEFRHSDFEPLDFELEIGSPDVPAFEIRTGSDVIRVMGKIDRVDGWLDGDKLYFRIVDYKSKSKSIRFRDVLVGRNLQMLLYMNAVSKDGIDYYQHECIPAGMLYSPARDSVIRSNPWDDDSKIAKKRLNKTERHGILLDDPRILSAMCDDSEMKLIPIKSRGTKKVSEKMSLLNAAQIGALASHVEDVLKEMARQLRNGNIETNPVKDDTYNDDCTYCDYRSVCSLDPDHCDTIRRSINLSDEEALKQICERGALQ